MSRLQITIQGEIHSSKNSRQILPTRSKKRPFVLAKSSAAKADEQSFEWQLASQRDTWERMVAGKSYPLFVTFSFRRKTRAKWDFHNIAQGLADAMVRAGYIPDDDVDHLIPVWGGYEISKDNPGCDFFLE